jgi:hypothetical protein
MRGNSINKRSTELARKLRSINLCPAENLADVIDRLKNAKVFDSDGNPASSLEKLRLEADIYKSLMPYVYPRLKSVDVNIGSEQGIKAIEIVYERPGVQIEIPPPLQNLDDEILADDDDEDG